MVIDRAMEHHFVQGAFNGEWRCSKCLAVTGEFPCPYGPLKPAVEHIQIMDDLSDDQQLMTVTIGPRCLKRSPQLNVSFNGTTCVLRSTNHARQRFEWTTNALFDRPPIVDNKMTFSLKATRAQAGGPVAGWGVESANICSRFPAVYGMCFCMDNDLKHLHHSHGSKNPNFTSEFGNRSVHPDEVVVCVYDLEGRTISYQRGSQQPVIAISDVPPSPLLYPCILIRDCGDIAELHI